MHFRGHNGQICQPCTLDNFFNGQKTDKQRTLFLISRTNALQIISNHGIIKTVSPIKIKEMLSMKDKIRIDEDGRIIVNECCTYRKLDLTRRDMSDIVREFAIFMRCVHDYALEKDLNPMLKGSLVVKALSFKEWLEQDMDDIFEQSKKYKDPNLDK